MLFGQPARREAARDAAAPSFSDCLNSIGRRLAAWINTCADYSAAAAAYEQLSRLSNAELHRRGLSRDTLARDVCKSCDRTADR
jgi:hypothetical protein